MLLLIIAVIITAIGIACIFFDAAGIFEPFEGIGCVLGGIFGAIAIIMVVVFMVTVVAAPSNTAKLISRYKELQYKLNHIEEFGPKTVQKEVFQWNQELAELKSGKNSIWTGMYYLEDLSEVDYITLK